ncbi:MAG: hypothetical protein R8G66_11265 [Cytophagales bacterium]|nr:hypothetical protein [Cytophagales bacterium]
MNDLQEIWNDIPESPSDEKVVENIISGKSVSEIDRFKKVLKVEMLASFGLLIPFWFAVDLMGVELFVLVCLVSIVGGILNLSTLWRLKRLELLDELREFLTNCIRILKSFVITFMLTVEIFACIVVVSAKSRIAPSLPWGEWLSASSGVLLIFLLIIINLTLFGYAWFFYIRRIKSLSGLLREINEAEVDAEA